MTTTNVQSTHTKNELLRGLVIARHPVGITSPRRSSFFVCVDCTFVVVMAFSVAWFRTPRRPARPRGGRARQAHIATPGPDPERHNDAHLAHAGRHPTRGRPRIPAWPRGRSASLRTSRGRNGFTEQPRAMATCGIARRDRPGA